ncbi:DUF4376 domain-containing protein [Rhizobium sp.]|jgi:hypothetical protein|uniref:DUF4376 domain-containing protein n=1 Tax=Rhizobium sp. TaxID=391 RepID=UPI000E92E79B|nr:hypothetical protein [Rhizobium sp.]
MQIVNFGTFNPAIRDCILFWINEDGQDWYEMRRGLTTWGEAGEFIDAVYGAWALIDPSTMRVTNVEFDPSRLVPCNKIVLGIDADVADIQVDMLFTGGSLINAALPITLEQVDRERDRRIDAGFVFDGVLFQSDAGSRENIAGAKSAASDAIMLGAQANDFGWQRLLDPNATNTFAWIATDNSLHPMDAQTVVRFGYAAMAHKQDMIFKARSLKAMDTIPADYATNDAYWS